MNKLSQIAIFLIASSAVMAGARGQNIYKCGTSYSQTPCADAVTINAADPRSKEQKAQADKLIKQDVASANAMEKARLAEEARAISQRKEPKIKKAEASEASENAEIPAKKKPAKPKEPVIFSVIAPAK